MSKDKPGLMVITSKPTGWSSRRLAAAARKLNIPIRFVNPDSVMLRIGADSVSFTVFGRRTPLPSCVIPRMGPGNYENSLALLGHLETAGVPVCNSRTAIETARDTYKTLLCLQKHGFKVPQTARIVSMKDLPVARKKIPGPPWILKTFTGAMGIGTMLVTNVDQLEGISATLWALGQPVLMQEFVHSIENTATDVRALVIGKKVLGAIQRRAMQGEFRANVHRGGKAVIVDLKKSDRSLALGAARAVGLEIAGIDWIVTKDGPVILELNATPGFRGFESATGIDVAAAIVEFAADKGRLQNSCSR